MELCQNVDNAVVLACRGEIRSPENSLLCVFGQANPAPTADDGIGRFSFGTLPFSMNVIFLCYDRLISGILFDVRILIKYVRLREWQITVLRSKLTCFNGCCAGNFCTFVRIGFTVIDSTGNTF